MINPAGHYANLKIEATFYTHKEGKEKKTRHISNKIRQQRIKAKFVGTSIIIVIRS